LDLSSYADVFRPYKILDPDIQNFSKRDKLAIHLKATKGHTHYRESSLNILTT